MRVEHGASNIGQALRQIRDRDLGVCGHHADQVVDQAPAAHGAKRVSDVVAGLKRLAAIARHVTGCHLTEDMRVQNALDDEASNWPGRYCSPCHRMSFDS